MIDYGSIYEAILADNRQMRENIATLERRLAELTAAFREENMTRPRPVLITNNQMYVLLHRAKGMSKDNRDTMWEALVFVRGTYERERAALMAEISDYDKGASEVAALALRYINEIQELEVQLAEARKNLAFADNLYAGAVDAISKLEAKP